MKSPASAASTAATATTSRVFIPLCDNHGRVDLVDVILPERRVIAHAVQHLQANQPAGHTVCQGCM